ncbi:MAG: hypothetical protein ABIP29_12375 [Candidatus Eisenbacteria bacterium]
MRRILLPLGMITVALVGFVAWMLVARDGASTRDAGVASAVPVAVVTVTPSRDTASETWRVALPPETAPPAPRRAIRPAPDPAPDWSALRAGVATPPGPATVSLALATPAPAELAFAMSARERRALIASAREPVTPPGPRGYRPGIAVIVPGGSTSDGVCR